MASAMARNRGEQRIKARALPTTSIDPLDDQQRPFALSAAVVRSG